jgi:DNA-directed RNA polymerase alpha subunit
MAIRYANVKSAEELARYPLEKLDRQRGVGKKSAKAIREALRNRGYEISADPARSAQ